MAILSSEVLRSESVFRLVFVLVEIMQMARPYKNFDTKTFESLCSIQCTKQEICDFFATSDKTLEAWCKRTYGMGFSDVFEQKRSLGKISLRRMQWRLAERNSAVSIFLGKQYLGQSDNYNVGMRVSSDDDPITKALKESGVLGDKQ